MDRQDYERYWDKGWLVVEGIFEPAEADAIADLTVSVWEREVAGTGRAQLVERAPDGRTLVPRKVDVPFTLEQGFRDFVLDPRLRRAVEQLIGATPLLLSDQIFMKPPRFGSTKPYHQDNAYFLCFPDDHVITAWIALDDVDEANGCLRYIDGSHRGPILPHEAVPGEPFNKVPPEDLIDLSKESLAEVKKGGVVFHHSKALHTSHRNESDRWRRGYATHWVTDRVTSETDTLDNAYFKRDDYPG